MKAKIIKIGNSQGIRIPKSLLEQTGLGNEVEIQVDGNRLIVAPLNYHPRAGWAEAFEELAREGNEGILDDMDLIVNKWDEEEWEW
jgi:antitoxin MazE